MPRVARTARGLQDYFRKAQSVRSALRCEGARTGARHSNKMDQDVTRCNRRESLDGAMFISFETNRAASRMRQYICVSPSSSRMSCTIQEAIGVEIRFHSLIGTAGPNLPGSPRPSIHALSANRSSSSLHQCSRTVPSAPIGETLNPSSTSSQ